MGDHAPPCVTSIYEPAGQAARGARIEHGTLGTLRTLAAGRADGCEGTEFDRQSRTGANTVP